MSSTMSILVIINSVFILGVSAAVRSEAESSRKPIGGFDSVINLIEYNDLACFKLRKKIDYF